MLPCTCITAIQSYHASEYLHSVTIVEKFDRVG